MTMVKPYTSILSVSANEIVFLKNQPSLIAVNLQDALNLESEASINLFKLRSTFLFYIDDLSTLILDTAGSDKIISFFLSNNYYTINSCPALLVKKELVSNKLSDLERSVKLQGWNQLSVLSCEKHAAWLSLQYLPVIEGNDDDVSNVLWESFENQANYIWFSGHSFIESYRYDETFFATLSRQLETNMQLKEILLKYIEVKKAYETCLSLLNGTEAKLRNADAFVALAKTKYKEDYMQLFHYYQNQYEVLPLWYKRFGHIIKVMTGKRTFASLFYNTKKQP